MRRLWLICILIPVMGFVNATQVTDRKNEEQETAEVLTTIGKIRGNFMQSRIGRRFFSARGIRFAEAPIGENRFKPAIPAKPWTTVFDATEEGPSCPQPGGLLSSEDCLRLNVYSPELPSPEKPGVKKPVLVFFHPGGFYSGSGQDANFGPEFLMDKDIVLVTVNYRLLSLGFISTGDSLAPGNLGLKDQVVALRWIQANIESFGGDSNNVTISGHSAGGWSVSLHMVSPMSKGLFHRAIAMSGAATVQKKLGNEQLDLAKRQANLLNCPTDTTQNMISCLRTKPAQAFADSLGAMFDWNYNPILLWSPVVEPEIPGVERFLTAEPEDLIKERKFHEVPLITGISKDEFGGVVVYWVESSRNGNNSLFDDLNNKWDKLAPILFFYERDTPRSKEISTEIRQFYFKDQPISVATVDGLAQLYADAVIGYQVHRFAKLIAEVSTKPVYYYEFSYQGRYSYNVWNETNKPYGVSHHDDLLYLFNQKARFPYFKTDDPEYQTVKRMTSMWCSFAKTSNPIPDNDETFANIEWDVFTPTNNKYLEIGDNLVMKTGLYAERRNEWDKLFPLHAEIMTNSSLIEQQLS